MNLLLCAFLHHFTNDILPGTLWPIVSSFFIFCCYFTRLKTLKIRQQNMINSENIGNFVLVIV